MLEKKGFNTKVLNSEKEVKDFINNHIPDETTVGLGNSITTCKLNIRNILASKGTTIFYSWDGRDNYNRSLDTFDELPRPGYYITRITAMTTAGSILMKDFDKKAADDNNFPEHVFAFVGLNRITDESVNTWNPAKYPVVSECPANIDFQVILLPFMEY